jgi:hypothetical protein
MQKFKRKSLYLALVAAVSSVGVASAANAAMNINGSGLGQVLIYPYYSTRAGMDTYLSVVNTTDSAKAVKVRFTEGKNSREVLDFNLYLSKNDMWTAAIVNTANGAKLITADKSCTSPAIPAAGKEFVNFAFSGTVVEGIVVAGGDGETASLDRTREGYFEIIEMGVITNTAIEAAVTHVSGVPANCAVVQASSMQMTSGDNALVPPTGGLAGTASLIGVAGGTDYGYDPVVIDSFASSNIWDAPGSILPDLTKGDVNSVVFYNGAAITNIWAESQQAVSALIMHDNLINEYVLDAATLSGTDWVVTMPTKRYFVPVDQPTVATSPAVLPPFTKPFWLGGACEPVSINYWNREEGSVSVTDFSPPQAGGASLCWETTVMTFNNSHVLGSVNEVDVEVAYQNGWLALSFDDAVTQEMVSIDQTPSTFHGLPTVGFMVQDFINQNAAVGVMATYGGNFVHKTTSWITGVQ